MNNKVTKIRHLGYKNKNQILLCKCNNCGALIPMYASHYYRGDNGCKCKKYGIKYPRLYTIWINLKTRCYNVNTPGYKDYGNRGVRVCDEWINSFETFLKWALSNGYDENLTIDRIDYNGNYEPKNCRWISKGEQNRNKRNNVNFIYKGKKYCMREISRLIGVNYKTINTFYHRHGYTATAKKYKLEEV